MLLGQLVEGFYIPYTAYGGSRGSRGSRGFGGSISKVIYACLVAYV